VYENVDGVSSAATCDLCERLRGRTDGRSDPVDATWTEDGPDHPPRRRERDENGSPKGDSSTTSSTLEKRDRTLRRDRVPAGESSARCASSVVRWNLAVRFQDKSTDKWRRIFLWVVLLTLASLPDLAATQHLNSAAIGPPKKDGGE
jgi:hypothetical protein